jgi:hypothetical protein
VRPFDHDDRVGGVGFVSRLRRDHPTRHGGGFYGFDPGGGAVKPIVDFGVVGRAARQEPGQQPRGFAEGVAGGELGLDIPQLACAALGTKSDAGDRRRVSEAAPQRQAPNRGASTVTVPNRVWRVRRRISRTRRIAPQAAQARCRAVFIDLRPCAGSLREV